MNNSVKNIEKLIIEAASYLCGTMEDEIREICRSVDYLVGDKKRETIFLDSEKTSISANISARIIDAFCVAKKANPKLSDRDALIIAFLHTPSLKKQFTKQIRNTALSMVIGDH